MKVTATISTKDRYFTTLPLVLNAIAMQTRLPDRIIIFDDGEHKDLLQEPLYVDLFSMLGRKGLVCEVIYGARKGQVANHQLALDMATTTCIWRLDDDTIPEPNVLKTLMEALEQNKDVGAVAGLVLHPQSVNMCPPNVSGSIKDIDSGINLQWYKHVETEYIPVEHLYSTFVYRVEAGKHGYNKDLSPVGHREETMFTYEMFRNGYTLLIDPTVVTWHMRQPTGGIRDYNDPSLWSHDEEIFKHKLSEYGINPVKQKLIVLNNGIGDHYAFKHVLPEIMELNHNSNITMAVCFPDIFKDITGISIISIADAMKICDISKYDIYKWMWDHNWNKNIVEAFREMYIICE